MSLDAVKILEISITTNSKNKILECIQKSLTNGAEKTKKSENNAPFAQKILTVVTPNPEQIVYAQRDIYFRKLLNQADIAIPDGTGVVWASKVLHSSRFTDNSKPIMKAIPGIEFMEDLVSLAAKKRVPIALIGGRGGLALSTLECLQKIHPTLTGWAIDGPEAEVHGSQLTVHGPENTEDYSRELAKRITESGVQMVFVGLGAPKQEYFIEKLGKSCTAYRSSMNDKRITMNSMVCMSVGGSFDEIAGRIPRAPQWVSAFGVKWLWRLVLEPWRIKRQFSLLTFVRLVLQKRYSLK